MSVEGTPSHPRRNGTGLAAGMTIALITAALLPFLINIVLFSLPLPGYTACTCASPWLETVCVGIGVALEWNLTAVIALICLFRVTGVPSRLAWQPVLAGYIGIFTVMGSFEATLGLAPFRIDASLVSADPKQLSFGWTQILVFFLITALVFRAFYAGNRNAGIVTRILHRSVVSETGARSAVWAWVLNVLVLASAAFLVCVVLLLIVILFSVPPFAKLHESTFHGLDLIKAFTLVPLSLLLLNYLGRFRMEAAGNRVARFERWLYSKGTFIAALFVVVVPLLMTGAHYLIKLL